MYGAFLHSFCVAETVREIKAVNATVMDDKSLCSLSCYRFSSIDGLTPNITRFGGDENPIHRKRFRLYLHLSELNLSKENFLFQNYSVFKI
jgi:hypothetical protein